MMSRMGLYFRTLRHLRLAQITGQIRVRWKKKFRDPAKVLRKAPGWKFSNHGGDLSLSSPVPAQDPRALAKGVFFFIKEEKSLGCPIDWEAGEMPRLWKYNLHYFDWLWSLLPKEGGDLETAKRVVRDWMENHPASGAACGWEPYPTSLRLMNWALLFGVRYREALQDDDDFYQAFLASMARQIKWLELNLETHIQANHLLENLAALTCVGSVLQGEACQALLAKMLPLLKREIDEQILDDGLHYERSPMYHLRVLWLVEMLGAVGNHEVQGIVAGVGERMKQALAKVRHPDGGIAQFNDAVLGIYEDSWRSKAEGGSWSLPEAGYYGYRNEEGDYLAIDAGAIGPNYQPGHAHADLLSFELSLAGTRVITDTGVGTYDAGALRKSDRASAAHNTLEIAGENSVEVWGSFRVGRRVEPALLEWDPRPEGLRLSAEHRGYAHLRGKPVHRRTFAWLNRELIITDHVTTSEPVTVAIRFHFAPGVSLEGQGKRVEASFQGGQFSMETEGPGDLSQESSLAHPTFGAGLERPLVIIRATTSQPTTGWVTRIRW
ncbi:alginate lyase family protein [Verrucomicrobiaceae bacterium 227]